MSKTEEPNIYYNYKGDMKRGKEMQDNNIQNNYCYNNKCSSENDSSILRDYGNKPFVININEVTRLNNNFRTALWTGEHLQLTLMCIRVNDCIGLEMHPNVDQFLRIEEGYGLVQMGDTKNNLTFERRVYDDYAIIIPAGKWHNLTNLGNRPIKLYSIYAPANHPFGTIHKTKEDEEHH